MRAASLALIVLTTAILALAQVPTVSLAQPLDPSQPGPFAVGITERSFTRPSSTTGATRSVTMQIWYPVAPAQAGENAAVRFGGSVEAPPARSSGPFPVLVFSHGSGTSPSQSSFLTSHLASHGFVVIAPTHPGNTDQDCQLACLPLNDTARAAFLDSAANRPADVSTALDQALALSASKDDLLSGLLKTDQIGVLGHSFGGWTALQVLALDPRFKAAVPMAPGVFAELLAMAEHVTAPTLVLAGDLDRLTRIADEQELSLSLTTGGGDHWFVVLRGAGHLSFTDLCGRIFGGCGPDDLSTADAQTAIKGFTTAFMGQYLTADTRYAAWLADTRPPYLDVTYSKTNTP